MHKLSEEAFEKDLMLECKDKLGFELFDATNEINSMISGIAEVCHIILGISLVWLIYS